MTEIKQFDKTNLKEIREAIDFALNQVRNTYNIDLKIENISFTRGEFSTKLKGASRDVQISTDSNAHKFRKYGLDSSIQGRKFNHRGQEYEIVGVNTRKSKNPIIVKNIKTRQEHICSPEFIKVKLS